MFAKNMLRTVTWMTLCVLVLHFQRTTPVEQTKLQKPNNMWTIWLENWQNTQAHISKLSTERITSSNELISLRLARKKREATSKEPNVNKIVSRSAGSTTYVLILLLLCIVLMIAVMAIIIFVFKPKCSSCIVKWFNEDAGSKDGGVADQDAAKNEMLFAERIDPQKGIVTGTMPKASDRSLKHTLKPVSSMISPEVRMEMERRKNIHYFTSQGSDFWKTQIQTMLVQRASEYRASQSDNKINKKLGKHGESDSESLPTVTTISSTQSKQNNLFTGTSNVNVKAKVHPIKIDENKAAIKKKLPSKR